MKKTFLSLFLWLCALLGYAQPAGVTVITHGFDALGTGNIPDWLNHGYEVAARYNQTHPTGPRATVLTNTDSGMWVIDSRDGNGTGNANAELIFVFNWSAYSNNLGHQRWLEAAADHLFALLVQPSIHYPLGTNTDIYSPKPGQLLRDKPTHFIGHSRGGVLLLQVLHRLRNHFSDVSIEHLTLLDPHPAGAMKDVYTVGPGQTRINNLPGVFGYAEDCGDVLCSQGVYEQNANYVQLKVPDNVLKADCYYRTEGNTYEPAINGSTWTVAAFSGVPVVNLGDFNRKLNNATMAEGSGVAGGAHSGVHVWYFHSLQKIGSIFANCYQGVPNNWFDFQNAHFLYNAISNPTGESCFNTGYYYSRLGGGYDLTSFSAVSPSAMVYLPTLNNQLSSRLNVLSTGTYPERVLNGDITKFRAGWFSGNTFSFYASNGLYSTNPGYISKNNPVIAGIFQRKITHNFMYFPVGLILKVRCKISALDLGSRVKVTLRNALNQTVLVDSQRVASTQFQDYLFNVDALGGTVGNFSVEHVTTTDSRASVQVQSVDLVPCTASVVQVQPHAPDVLTLPVGNWAGDYITKATKWGLINKYSWLGATEPLTVGEAAQSIVITANLLGSAGYSQLPASCFEARSRQPFVSILKQGGFLPANLNADDPLPLGVLADVLNRLLLLGGAAPYPYQVNRADQNTVIAANASYRSSLLALYNAIGYRSTSNRWKVAGWLFDGLYDLTNSTRKATGNEITTKGVFAKLLTSAYEFKYYQATGNTRSARLAATNTVPNPANDIILLGSKVEFEVDSTGTPPPISMDGQTEFMRSGDVRNFTFPTNQLADGTKVFFHWGIDGATRGIGLTPQAPYTSTFQGVRLQAPTVTTTQTFQFYICLSTEDGRVVDMVKEIVVSPNNPGGNTNLAYGEYFIDTDPGTGQATAMPLAFSSYGLDATLPISTSGLSQGIHLVGMRVRDSNDKWSLTHARPFLLLGSGNGVDNRIEQAEYFYDEQVANTVVVNVSPDANDQFVLPLSMSLTTGVHSISFRVKNSQNIWSLSHTKVFLVLGQSTSGANSIVQVEYFYDTDPGETNRVRRNITLDANNQVVLPLSISLTQGVHSVSFRVRDAQNNWSLSHTKIFLVIGGGTGTNALSQIEYFFDSDPGIGNGTQLPYTATGDSQMLIDINATTLAQGVHVLYVRVKNTLNQWSLTHAKPFLVLDTPPGSATITRIEYYLDSSDPGQGNATNIPFTANSEGGVTAVLNLQTVGVSEGIHTLNVRARDSNGTWSSVRNSGFNVTAPVSCTAMISIKSGEWTDPTTWSCGRIPVASDVVTVESGHTVNVPTGVHQVKIIRQRGRLRFLAGGVLLVPGQ